MQLINADAAGVAFSCDPVSGREDVCLVSANYGLGESVVQGRVEPDTYTINRVNFRSLRVCVGAKQSHTVANYIGGRAYFNIALYQWLIYDSIGLKPRAINLFMGGHHPDIQLPDTSPYICKQGIRRVLTIVKNMRLVSRYKKRQQAFYSDVDDLVRQFNQTDITALSDAEFLDFAEQVQNRYYDFSDKYMTLCGAIGSYGIAINLLRPQFGDEAIGLVNALVAGRCRLPSAEQGYDLLVLAEIARHESDTADFLRQLARLYDNNDAETKSFANQWQSLAHHSMFKNKFQDYLAKYGFRANYELDCSQPRWLEDPTYLLVNVANMIDSADLTVHRRRQQQSYETAMTRLNTKLGYLK